ncbi:heterokaryon incompatibility protein-domain-containing protein [Trichoderma sp. SZMC 28011]
MSRYNYDEIDLKAHAIRLLRLLPGSASEQISCEIVQAWLYPEKDILPYEALSYTWGSAKAPENITVNGKLLAVTENLYKALQQLRYPNQERILWVDAICINQDDNKERGHQVQQMGDIFKKAGRVIFWLGENTPFTSFIDNFMTVFGRLQQISLGYPYSSWSQNDENWRRIWTHSIGPALANPESFYRLKRGLWHVLNQPWFTRVWVLQEVTNAREALLCCGSKTLAPWILSLATKLLDVQPDYHEEAVIDIMPGPWRASSWWSESQDLYTLLTKFGDSQATEPRDLIYALKGMSSDARNEPSLYADYNKPEQQLVQDAILLMYPLKVEHLAIIKPPATVRDLIHDLKGICRRIASNCHEIYSRQDMKALIQLKSPQVQSQIFVELLSRDGNEDLAKHLLRDWGMQVKIIRKHLHTIAWSRLSADMAEIVFRLMDEDAIVTVPTIIMAASNEACGDRIIEFFSQHGTGYLPVSDDLMRGAVLNEGCGCKIMERILRNKKNHIYLPDDIFDNVANWGDSRVKKLEIIGRLVDHDENYDKLTEKLLLLAVRIPPSSTHDTRHEYKNASVWLTERLLVHRRKPSDTTEILQRAVANSTNAGKLTSLLLLYWGKRSFIITDDILWAAVTNSEGGHDALALLFREMRREMTIPQTIIDFALSSKNDQIRQLFTQYCTKQSEDQSVSSIDISTPDGL